jgi:hypothetical protein
VESLPARTQRLWRRHSRGHQLPVPQIRRHDRIIGRSRADRSRHRAQRHPEPFNLVEKRSSGPYAAGFDKRGSNWAIEWSARQAGGEQREVKITPEMQQALEKLRQQLDKIRTVTVRYGTHGSSILSMHPPPDPSSCPCMRAIFVIEATRASR